MVKRIARADPEIGDAFLAGDVGLHEADAVARLPAGEQRETVAGGADGIKEKAAEVRDRREAASERERREAAWRRERVRPIPSPPPIAPRPEALPDSSVSDAIADAEAALAAMLPSERAVYFRRHLAESLKAASPEQLAELLPDAWEAATPEQRESVAGVQMKGVAGNVDASDDAGTDSRPAS
jgi:hypothetical protein